MKPPVKSTTSGCLMPRLSETLKPSSTTKMCRYGTLIAWAEELGHDEIVRFLTTNLDEEKERTPSSTRGTMQRRQREGVNSGLMTIVRSAVAAPRYRRAAISLRALGAFEFILVLQIPGRD